MVHALVELNKAQTRGIALYSIECKFTVTEMNYGRRVSCDLLDGEKCATINLCVIHSLNAIKL